ncbi:sigma-70 family RNA polymerase sigma factor [Aceticella autotrophica]|uniref:Sigma-70 family RNA polymerase sigma factor n=1 Tax=Aceticella autotrophica TaxID=2755338 RepID=A0A975AXD2_9THEO|nr:RNA polymerase sigma factor SigX [Aceticella autotrophica]QSZ28234.1 sigma-70 family RNA polymerase sigma factor [Aceticella autotrophica]
MLEIEESFKDIFERYYPKILKQISWIVKDEFKAEDLAQEVFIKFLKKPPRHNENIGGWLSKGAINHALNYIRSEKSTKTRELEVFKITQEESFINPEEMAIENLEKTKVKEILLKMSKRDMMCLLLKHSGYSYEEISNSLGIKKSSVGTTIARAQKKFKELYEKEV